MEKIAIIGLGLVGNSIGMAIRKAYSGAGAAGGSTVGTGSQQVQVTGFDPDRMREEQALRKYFSVDEIAPSLEIAVRDAQLVIIATPAAASREVLEAISPFLDQSTTVTDTASAKEQIMKWARKSLGPSVSFVGGHPFSKIVDLETADDTETPSPDLFRGAPYCIMPMPSAAEDALPRVIGLAELLGARPLFTDPFEHDSFVAAISHLPALMSAALVRATTTSPAWSDMRDMAHDQYGNASGSIPQDTDSLVEAALTNRQLLLRWVDGYMTALYELRDMLSNNDQAGLKAALQEAHDAQRAWANSESDANDEEARLRAEMRQALDEARPTRNLLGGFISNRVAPRKDQQDRNRGTDR